MTTHQEVLKSLAYAVECAAVNLFSNGLDSEQQDLALQGYQEHEAAILGALAGAERLASQIDCMIDAIEGTKQGAIALRRDYDKLRKENEMLRRELAEAKEGNHGD